MKLILAALVILSALLCGAIYGYKEAINDDAALRRYLEMAYGYAHLKILEEKGADSLRKFLIQDIRLTTSIHTFQMNEQSFFSGLLGPKNEAYSGTNRSEYYIAIKKYYQSLPTSEDNRKILKELEWLLKSTQ